MPQLSSILDEFIIKSKEKLNQSNLKMYCKCCVEALGEKEGKKACFPNKTDRILKHLKKCKYFLEEMTPEIQDEIFSLSKSNEKQAENRTENQQAKWSCKFLIFLDLMQKFFYWYIEFSFFF
jgi:hypothetical protein